MDELLGVLIFVVIAIISAISKLKNKNPEMPEPWESGPPSWQDLPDKTKEVLFGRREVRKATPAESREFEERTPEVLWQEDEWTSKPRKIPQRPVQPLPRPRQQQPRPQQQPIARQTPRKTAAPRKSKPVQVEEDTGPKMRPGDIRIPRAPISATQRAATLQPKQTLSAYRVPEKKPAPQPAPTAPRLLRDISDVRRGIILAEILGPPVSLRRD